MTTPTPTTTIRDLLAQVEGGLQAHVPRLDEARTARDYYEMKNERHLEARRDETWDDFRHRPKRFDLLTREAVEALTEHLYTPGPVRVWEGSPAAAEWLAATYERIGINARMHHADVLSHLGGVVALEVAIEAVDDQAEADAGAADGEVCVYVYGADEYTVWTSLSDPSEPWAVCTRTCDPLSQVTEYRLWTADTRWTFRSRSAVGATAGGRVADLVDETPNPLGRLPFVFASYEPAVDTFWVACPGPLLAEVNHGLDRAWSNLAQAVEEHLCPIGIARNVRSDFRLRRVPGGFAILPKDAQSINGQGTPDLEYLQATIDAETAIREAESAAERALRQVGVPPTRGRGSASASSGIALLVEAEPLLRRARTRQPHWSQIEQELAELLLTVGGQDAEGRLALSWPEYVSLIPDAGLADAEERDLALGLTSRLEILQRRRGITRDAAVALLERLAADAIDEARIAAGPLAPPPEAEPTP